MIYACVILHNMTVEERIKEVGDGVELSDEDHARYYDETDERNNNVNPNGIFSRLPTIDDTGELEHNMAQRFTRANNLHYLLTDRDMHVQLKKDLYADIIRRSSKNK